MTDDDESYQPDGSDALSYDTDDDVLEPEIDHHTNDGGGGGSNPEGAPDPSGFPPLELSLNGKKKNDNCPHHLWEEFGRRFEFESKNHLDPRTGKLPHRKKHLWPIFSYRIGMKMRRSISIEDLVWHNNNQLKNASQRGIRAFDNQKKMANKRNSNAVRKKSITIARPTMGDDDASSQPDDDLSYDSDGFPVLVLKKNGEKNNDGIPPDLWEEIDRNFDEAVEIYKDPRTGKLPHFKKEEVWPKFHSFFREECSYSISIDDIAWYNKFKLKNKSQKAIRAFRAEEKQEKKANKMTNKGNSNALTTILSRKKVKARQKSTARSPQEPTTNLQARDQESIVPDQQPSLPVQQQPIIDLTEDDEQAELEKARLKKDIELKSADIKLKLVLAEKVQAELKKLQAEAGLAELCLAQANAATGMALDESTQTKVDRIYELVKDIWEITNPEGSPLTINEIDEHPLPPNKAKYAMNKRRLRVQRALKKKLIVSELFKKDATLVGFLQEKVDQAYEALIQEVPCQHNYFSEFDTKLDVYEKNTSYCFGDVREDDDIKDILQHIHFKEGTTAKLGVSDCCVLISNKEETTCITHHDKFNTVLIVLRGIKYVWLAPAGVIPESERKGSLYDYNPFELNKEELESQGWILVEVLAGESMVIPAWCPHCIRSVDNTLAVSFKTMPDHSQTAAAATTKAAGEKKAPPRASVATGKKKAPPRGSVAGGKRKAPPPASVAAGKKKAPPGASGARVARRSRVAKARPKTTGEEEED